MIKKANILVLVLLLLVFLSPGQVHAEGKLAILSHSAHIEFPAKLSFSMSVESSVNVVDIRLHYVVDQDSFARVTSEAYSDFVPQNRVEAEWTWDMRKTGGLAPGSRVDYWWTAEDASGNRVETAPAQVQFDDNRYPWESLTEDKVTIYWYEGKPSFAQELMSAARQALDRLANNTGAYLKKSVKIYIYGDTRDLLGALIYPQEWTGGVTLSRYGVIAIGIAPNELDWGKKTIAHELTHLVVHQMTFNPYSDLPTWLDEGLATYAEGKLDPVYKARLSSLIAEGGLSSTRSLSSPFSAHAREASLGYIKSYSLVEFLISKYGQDRMLELLNTFSEGSGYDEALGRVYGFDMDGLDASWRNYITSSAKPGMHPALVGALATLATMLLLVLSLTLEAWAWRRGW